MPDSTRYHLLLDRLFSQSVSTRSQVLYSMDKVLIHMCVCMYICVSVCVCVGIYVMCISVCAYACVRLCMWSLCMYAFIYDLDINYFSFH